MTSSGAADRRHRPSARREAVVLGAGVNLVEVVRALALAGVNNVVVTGRHEPAALSRHVRRIMVWDWSSPPLGGDEDLAERLVRYGRSRPARPPLLFTSDEALLFVSAHRVRLAEAFRFVLADAGTVEAMTDKGAFVAVARRLALPVPPTRVLVPVTGSTAPDVRDIGFPLVVKPQRRDRSWHEVVGTTQKALRVSRAEDFEGLWPQLCALGMPVLAQHTIEGAEDRVESYHVYVDDRGTVVAEFTGRKIRTWPAEYGHTTALTITDAEDLRCCGRRVIDALGLTGVAKLDFKRGRDGALHLLEVNPRFHLWHHPGARAGVNIPAIVHADLTGRPRPAASAIRAGLTWCHPRDLAAARRAGVPLATWVRWALGCEAKAFWSWEDPVPALGTAVSRQLHHR